MGLISLVYSTEESRLERAGDFGLNGKAEPHYFCPVSDLDNRYGGENKT